MDCHSGFRPTAFVFLTIVGVFGCQKTDTIDAASAKSVAVDAEATQGTGAQRVAIPPEGARAESRNTKESASPVDASGQAGSVRGRVKPIRTPDGGLQPQAVIDESDVLHLVYYKGDPLRGDLFYVRRHSGSESFTEPIRVNSQPGSAVAVGTIRGAQIALGRNGRIHVTWNGSSKAEPYGPSNSAPMLYTRSNDAGDGFEPQRNLCQYAYGLDGGGSVAADEQGNVYVTWHAGAGSRDETGRRVWVAASNDDGATFAPERAAYSEDTGACGCCGMRAFADRRGTLYLLYRAAGELVHRDMILLSQAEREASVRGEVVGPWEVNACPMSSAAFAEGPSRVWAAWETKQQIFFASVDPSTLEIAPALSPSGGNGTRKHPSLAVNRHGEVLVVWAEATGWEKGGEVAWQVFTAEGLPVGSAGKAEGVHVWSFASAVADPSGDFWVVY